jgi:YHS domain-containing protein
MEITTNPPKQPVVIGFQNDNWIGDDPLPRDQQQSHRLHEPEHMISTIDPVTGHDVIGAAGHPSIVDGNLTIYFESEATRKTYQDTPANHPFEKLPGLPGDEDDRGG